MNILTDPVTSDEVIDVLAHIDASLLNQKCLDHGFVKVLDCLPRLVPRAHPDCDFALADAARISYQRGTRKVSADSALIDNLIRNKHTSPIEMGQLKYHLRMPVFCMRQHIRHRMSSTNEESARYSQLSSDFYIPEPEHWAINTSANKQATQQGAFTLDQAKQLHDLVQEHSARSYALYEAMLHDDGDFPSYNGFEEGFDSYLSEIATKIPGLAREQARMILGVNVYTSSVWSIDLKNQLDYLRLRTDKHAQYEIRVFADAMARVVAALFPSAWRSFKDNFIDGVNFSGLELSILTKVFASEGEAAVRLMKSNNWSKRRLTEFQNKAAKFNLGAEFFRAAAEQLK